MRRTFVALVCWSVAILLIGGAAVAQQGAGQDPRTGLRPGFLDAGAAARNIELLTTLPKPEGFFDPDAPAGRARQQGPPPGARGGRARRCGPEAVLADLRMQSHHVMRHVLRRMEDAADSRQL